MQGACAQRGHNVAWPCFGKGGGQWCLPGKGREWIHHTVRQGRQPCAYSTFGKFDCPPSELPSSAASLLQRPVRLDRAAAVAAWRGAWRAICCCRGQPWGGAAARCCQRREPIGGSVPFLALLVCAQRAKGPDRVVSFRQAHDGCAATRRTVCALISYHSVRKLHARIRSPQRRSSPAPAPGTRCPAAASQDRRMPRVSPQPCVKTLPSHAALF